MNTFLLSIYTISALVSLVLLCISIHKSDKEKTTNFSFFIMNICLYIFGTLLERSATSISHGVITNDIQYIGIAFVAPSFLLLVCEYADKPITNKKIIMALLIIPIVSLILALTYPINGLFYQNFDIDTNMGINYVVVKSSIYRDIFYAYFFFIFMLSFYFVVNAYLKGGEFRKRRVAFLIKGAIIPFIAIIAYLFKLSPYGIDFTPIVLIFVCLYYAYHILVKNAFLTIPFARRNVIENMRDGYILVDSSNNYLDSNMKAKEIFPVLSEAKVGEAIKNLNEKLEKVLKSEQGNFTEEFDIVQKDNEISYYSLRKSITKVTKKTTLSCLIFHDITYEKNMVEDLKYRANYDSLTKIYNRKAFFIKANDLFYESIRTDTPFAIFIIDIDYFKTINDNHGHHVGDIALVEIVETIKKNLRKNDIIARYGGEEFVLFIENVTHESAFRIGEKLRQAVEKNTFNLYGIDKKITISIGVETYNKDKHNDVDNMLAIADDLLYKAKRAGRNKVVIE